MPSYAQSQLGLDDDAIGPIARPVVRRSQYLADALRALQPTGENPIRSPAQLGVNLLAQALLQYGQSRNDRRLSNSIEKDALNDPLTQAFQGFSGGQPTPSGPAAPQIAAPPPEAAPAPSAAPPGSAPTPAASAMATALAGPGPPPVSSPLAAALGGAPAPTLEPFKLTAPVTSAPGSGWGYRHPPMAGATGGPGRPHEAVDYPTAEGTPVMSAGPGVAHVVQNRGYGNEVIIDHPGGIQTRYAHLVGVDIQDGQQVTAQQPIGRAGHTGVARGNNVHFETWQNGVRVNPAHMVGSMITPGPTDQYGPLDHLPANAPPPPPPSGPQPAEAPPVAPTPPVAPGGLPQQAAQPSPGPQARGLDAIPTEQRQYILSLLQNPRTHAQGVQLANAAMARAFAPIQYRTATQNGVTVFYDPENPATHFTMPADVATRSQVMSAQEAGITGAPPGMMVARDPNGNITVVYQPPAGMQQGPDGRLGPRPGMETTSGPAAPGSGFTPGTVTQHDPMGATSVLQAPPTGYQGPGGAGGPVAMGPNDPHSPAIRVPALVGIQQQLRPQLDEARDLAANINSARSGAQLHNGPGDILLMNGLQHLTDTGIVRQEDMTNQIHSAGLPGTIESTMQWLRGGGQFAPAQRQAMLAAAERLYGPRLQNLRAQVEGHRHLLDEQFGAGSYDYVVPPEVRQQLGWEPHPGQPGIADVAGALTRQIGEVTQHAQHGQHRVTGVRRAP